MKNILILLLMVLLFGCSTTQVQVERITIKGSDTMLLLCDALAEAYMKINPGTSVYVEGGGTVSGVKALTDGRADICTASRTLKPTEAKLLAERYGSLGISTVVAKDALSIFTNINNKVDNLTLEQVKKIFTGDIRTWQRLGGENDLIDPVIRNTNSGTYLYFKEHVLEGEDYLKGAVVIPTTKLILEYVSENPTSIGYGGIGYVEGVKHIDIDGVTPSEENVNNNSYPISRYLYFYTSHQPEGKIKKFVDWVISADGQKIVRSSGFIPAWQIKY